MDERYLEFNDKTSHAFSQFPYLEPLRYFIFKDLLIKRKSVKLEEYVKHWVRPLLRRKGTRGCLSNRADVLIWVESGREVIGSALLPVFRELKARGIKVQLVSFKGPGDLPASTLNFKFPARALTPMWGKHAWEVVCKAEPALRNRALAPSFYFACATVQSLFDELQSVLHAIAPRVVLCASTQLMGGAALMVASRLKGISTLLLQHGILQPFYVPLLADYMCTWGASSNETLIRLGISADRLMALGSPRHDSMWPSTNGKAKSILERTLSLPDKPTFVFFSNGNDVVRNGSAPLQCAQWLEATAAQYSRELNVVIRLHPNEDGSLYRNSPHLHVICEPSDLGTILDGCDWVGSLCSTVLYEALLYRRQVWQFYADGWPELADNWRYGLACRVSSQDELSEMIGRMLDNPNSHHGTDDLAAQVFQNHGRARLAIADFVQCELGAKRPGLQGEKHRRELGLSKAQHTDHS